jgi:Protein of unknown function (DUF2889)
MTEELPLHRRTITYEAFTCGADSMRVVGRFVDERPWSPASPPNGVLHQMQLEATVRVSDRTITSARADMSAYPHAECPAVTAGFEQLVGLRVVGGFGREINKRFAGVLGCSHLHELVRGLGPAIVQAAISWHSRNRADAQEVQSSASPGTIGTCHVWAPGGIGEQKFAAGWRIGDPEQPNPYPVPPLAHFRTPAAAEQTTAEDGVGD